MCIWIYANQFVSNRLSILYLIVTRIGLRQGKCVSGFGDFKKSKIKFTEKTFGGVGGGTGRYVVQKSTDQNWVLTHNGANTVYRHFKRRWAAERRLFISIPH